MLSIIDRYIAKSFVLYFLAGLLVFVTVFLAVDFMSAFVRFDVEFSVLARYYLYYIPDVIYQMVPVACLLATLFTLSTLNRNNELVALFSMGVSLARVSAPILAMIGVVSVLTFWASDWLLPTFTKQKNYVYYMEIKKRPGLYSTVKTDKIWYRSDNVLFNIQTLNSKESKAQGLTLYYFDEAWNLKQMIRASEVLIGGANWELLNGTVTLFTEETSFPLMQSFDVKKIRVGEDVADLETSSHSSDVMTLAEMRRFIKKNNEAGLDTLRYEVDYQAKYSFAFAAFVMSLMGIPFAVTRRRSGGGFLNVGICMGLALGYWILYSSSITLGRFEYLPPWVAAWGPNVLVGAFAAYSLLRLRR